MPMETMMGMVVPAGAGKAGHVRHGARRSRGARLSSGMMPGMGMPMMGGMMAEEEARIRALA